MTQTFWPFPKSSAGTQVLEPQWTQMARNWLATGVLSGFLNQLAVTASGNAMQVSIDTGAANIMGAWLKNDTSVAMPIAAADPTNPRIDVIAVRVDWVANTVAFVVLQGVPNANPVAPALTQTDILITPATARWEIALANVTVPAGATTIQAANVADQRTFTAGPTSVPTPGATAQYDSNSNLKSNAFSAIGLTGATQPSRYVGATVSGAPTSGTFKVGDFVLDLTAAIWMCKTAGSPGTWTRIGVANPLSALSGGTRFQSGETSISITAAGGQGYASVNFPVPYPSGTQPVVLAFVAGLSTNAAKSQVWLQNQPTYQGFTVAGESDQPNTLYVAWLSIA